MEINPIATSLIQQTQQKKSEVDGDAFENILKQAQETQDKKKLQEACKQFEAVFLSMLMKDMRSTVQDGGLMPKSNAREIFESMLDEKIAQEATKGPGIGLAQQMYKQLSRNIKINTIDENI
ncbi:rod-binding protein [Clostridiaceae bacterium 35-E11]